jgi:hypothetical protein
MKKIRTLIEEQERMISIMNFQMKDNSHDILSEQFTNVQATGKSTVPSWGGGKKGEVYFRSIVPELATDITRKKYSLFNYRKVAKYIKQDIEPTIIIDEPEIVTLPDYNVGLVESSFNDNQINPDFTTHSHAKEEFNKIVEDLVKYIGAGGIGNLNNMTIQGSADSAKPGLSGHDHGNNPYDGITDSSKRNQWLADKRAENYSNLIIKTVKEETGEDITIKILPGNNYYGQEGKRGLKWRSIEFKSNAEPYTPPTTGNPISEPTSDTPPDDDKKEIDLPTTQVTLSGPNGKEVMDGFIYTDGKNYKGPAILNGRDLGFGVSRPVTEDGLWNGKSTTSGSIKNGKLFIGGFEIGEIYPYDAQTAGIRIDGSIGNPAPTQIAGPITAINFVRTINGKTYYMLEDWWFGLV